MMKERKKSESGQIILFVLFVVLFMMLFVSLFVSRTLLKQTKTADNIASSVQAYYIADSGSEYALYRFKYNCPTGSELASCIGQYYAFGPETCNMMFGTSSRMYITGTYRGQTSRAIELSWAT